MTRSKAIENGSDLEKKVISLLKENERLVNEITNQRLKRNDDHKIAQKHDSMEAYYPFNELKDYRKRICPEYLKNVEDESVRQPNPIKVIIKLLILLNSLLLTTKCSSFLTYS